MIEATKIKLVTSRDASIIEFYLFLREKTIPNAKLQSMQKAKHDKITFILASGHRRREIIECIRSTEIQKGIMK